MRIRCTFLRGNPSSPAALVVGDQPHGASLDGPGMHDMLARPGHRAYRASQRTKKRIRQLGKWQLRSAPTAKLAAQETTDSCWHCAVMDVPAATARMVRVLCRWPPVGLRLSRDGVRGAAMETAAGPLSVLVEDGAGASNAARATSKQELAGSHSRRAHTRSTLADAGRSNAPGTPGRQSLDLKLPPKLLHAIEAVGSFRKAGRPLNDDPRVTGRSEREHAQAFGSGIEGGLGKARTYSLVRASSQWQQEDAAAELVSALVEMATVPEERAAESVPRTIRLLKLMFLREASSLSIRFRHPWCLAAFCVILFFANTFWHHLLALRFCSGQQPWVDMRVTDGLPGCEAAAALDVTVSALHIAAVALSVGNWATHGALQWWLSEALVVPRVLSTFFLIPAGQVLAAAGSAITAADMASIACGIGLLNAVSAATSVLAQCLSAASCFASMLAFVSHAGVWPEGRVEWGQAVGMALLSMAAFVAGQVVLDTVGWAPWATGEVQSPFSAPLVVAERALARVVRRLYKWLDSAVYAVSLGGVLVYAVGWVTLVGAIYCIIVALLTARHVSFHVIWLLLLPLALGMWRKTSSDSVRFRDAAIGNLVPDDVAEALMHTMPGNDGRVWAGNQEKEPSATHLSVHKTISKDVRQQSLDGKLPETAESMLPPRVVVDRRASELSNAPVESSVGQRASSERGAKGLQTVNTSVAARHNMVFFKTYDDVTMVFSDVVSYTDMSSHSAPIDVLSMLHGYFSRLDAMVESLGAYKYETVGDAYVVAVNLQRPEPQHPLMALRIAVSMVALAAQVDKADGTGKLKIRVGIHSGPVAGGVIGTRRTLLTLCGDTLNVAARMESNAKPGHIRLTKATASRLPANIQAVLRFEEVDIKGKGRMETAIVNALSSDLGMLVLKT